MGDAISDQDMAPGSKQNTITSQTSAGPSAAIPNTGQSHHILTLTANHGTISTMANGLFTGQMLMLTVLSSGGSWQFLWPSTIKWGALGGQYVGTPPIGARVSGESITVTFRWDGTQWLELNRSGSFASWYNAAGTMVAGTSTAGQPAAFGRGANGTILTPSDQGGGSIFGVNWNRLPIGMSGLGPTGVLAETMSRADVSSGAVVAAGSTFQRLTAIWLQEGTIVTNLNFMTGATAGVGLTNSVASLYSYHATAPVLRAQSATNAATPWAANTARSYLMTTPGTYTVVAQGGAFFYVSLSINASTTMPSFMGCIAPNVAVNTQAGISSGDTTVAQTTSAASPASTLTPVVGTMWAWVT